MRSSFSPRAAMAAAFLAAVTACGGSGGDTTGPVDNSPPTNNPPAADQTPLRTYAAAKNRNIGVAIDAGFRYAGSAGTNFRNLVAQQFNLLVAENDMKPSYLQPSRGVFTFVKADSLVAFAEASNMKMRGHTLVWHQQLPQWMKDDSANVNLTTDSMRAILVNHITNVVSHFKGHVVEWDVVNEAFNDNGTRRASLWQAKIGDDYIERAFIAARAADPDVKLFYNDYNIEGLGTKSDAVYTMVQDFKNRGIPIDGVGFQSHFIAGQVPSTLASNIKRFSDLGLLVHITELDIRVPTPASTASLQQQATDYTAVLNACFAASGCNTVVTWGLSDKESWVPNTFSGQGAALLYDQNYAIKPAYTAVQAALK